MANETGADYLAIVELDGQRRVIKASSGLNIEVCRQHIQQINPKMKILELRRITSHAEIVEANERVRADPNYQPIHDIKEIAVQTSGFVESATP